MTDHDELDRLRARVTELSAQVMAVAYLARQLELDGHGDCANRVREALAVANTSKETTP